jgi:hypothetical protein
LPNWLHCKIEKKNVNEGSRHPFLGGKNCPQKIKINPK